MRLLDLASADRHRAVSADFGDHLDAVRDWDSPTPVDGWVTRDIVTHLIEWSRGFLADGGTQLPDIPPPADSPVAAWRAHRQSIQQLLDSPGADQSFSHPMVGTHRLADAVDRFYTADVYMHTWDLVTANGVVPELDTQFAEHLLAGMGEIESLLRSSGQYGPAVPVAPDADAVTRLVGFIGRDPNWSNGNA